MNESGHQARPLLNESQLTRTLVQILDRVQPILTQVEYRLIGSGAALLYGVELPATDIDILVKERRAVDLFAQALAPFRCITPPIYLEGQRQYRAEFLVDGIKVDILTVEIETQSDAIETYGPGPWLHYEYLPCEGYMIPTVRLELRLITELGRGREDRYCPILEFLRCYGCDAELVCRAMEALGMDDTLQRNVLIQLSGEL